MGWLQALRLGSTISGRSRTQGLAAWGWALGALLAAAPLKAQVFVPLGAQFQVNAFTTREQVRPSVGSDGAGGFVVVWDSYGSSGTDSSGDSIHGQRFSSSGAPLGGQFQVNSYTSSNQYGPRVGPDGAGGFVVVWQSRGSPETDNSPQGQGYSSARRGRSQAPRLVLETFSIQGQRYSSAGVKLGAQFQVNSYTTKDQDEPAVGPDGAGGFVVVWKSYGSFGTDDSYGSIQGQRYSSIGVKLGAQFQVNSYITGDQESPAVSSDDGGGFLVVWDNFASSIQGQRYSSTGAALGAQFQVNSYTTNLQYGPAVGPDGAGGFLVVWTSGGSSGNDRSGRSIQGQRYSSTGAKLGAQFQINSYTTDNQANAAIGLDGSGGFVVVWNSYGSSATDSSYRSIQGQRYGSAGVALGAQFQINSYTTSRQTRPVLGPGGAGSFVVVWDSDGSAGTDNSRNSIQAQRFGPATATATRTATATATRTATITATRTPTATATRTATATATRTSTSTTTRTPTRTSTVTPTITQTPTITLTATITATGQPTATITSTATETPTATQTLTSTPSGTATASPTDTATSTPTATATSTPTSTPTATATATSSPTRTATATSTSTRTPTSSATPTPTATETATQTPTKTATPIPTRTLVPTQTPAPTSTPLPTGVPTFTPLATPVPVVLSIVPPVGMEQITLSWTECFDRRFSAFQLWRWSGLTLGTPGGWRSVALWLIAASVLVLLASRRRGFPWKLRLVALLAGASLGILVVSGRSMAENKMEASKEQAGVEPRGSSGLGLPANAQLIFQTSDPNDRLYVDAPLQPGTLYSYQVLVLTDVGATSGSNIVSTETVPLPTATPTVTPTITATPTSTPCAEPTRRLLENNLGSPGRPQSSFTIPDDPLPSQPITLTVDGQLCYFADPGVECSFGFGTLVGPYGAPPEVCFGQDVECGADPGDSIFRRHAAFFYQLGSNGLQQFVSGPNRPFTFQIPALHKNDVLNLRVNDGHPQNNSSYGFSVSLTYTYQNCTAGS
jgi:hypothetical protein